MKKIYREYESIAKSAGNDTDNVGLLTFYNDVKKIQIFKREWFDKTIDMPFEHTTIPVAQGFDNVMRMYYGDNYMTPMNIPSDHGSYGQIIIDTHRSYKEVLSK